MYFNFWTNGSCGSKFCFIPHFVLQMGNVLSRPFQSTVNFGRLRLITCRVNICCTWQSNWMAMSLSLSTLVELKEKGWPYFPQEIAFFQAISAAASSVNSPLHTTSCPSHGNQIYFQRGICFLQLVSTFLVDILVCFWGVFIIAVR